MSDPRDKGGVTGGPGSQVAWEALVLAKQNERDINQHEDLCAERYGHIHAAIADQKAATDRIWGFMWKVGGAGFTLILAMLGFMIVQMLDANDRAQREQQAQIQLLQQKLIDAQAGRQIH